MSIHVTIKTIPHSAPIEAVELFAKLVVKEILRQEHENRQQLAEE